MPKIKIFPKKFNKENALGVAVKLALVFFVFASLMGIVYIGIKPYQSHFREGDISDRDVFAPFNFTYKEKIDEEATEKLRREAAAAVSPVYEFDSTILIQADEAITEFFAVLKRLKMDGALLGENERLAGLRSGTKLELSDSALSAFLHSDRLDKTEAAIKETVYEIADRGILKEGDEKNLKEGKTPVSIMIHDPISGSNEEISAEALFTVAKARETADKKLSGEFARDKKLKRAAEELTYLFLHPNLELDEALTQKRREETAAKISPVYKETLVKKNEIILERGQKILKLHLNKFDELNLIGSLKTTMGYLVGLGIVLAVFLALSGAYLRLYEPKVFKSNKLLLLIALNIVFITAVSEAIVLSPLSSYLMPVACMSIVLTMLINSNVAFLFSVFMSVFCGVIAGNKFGVTIILMAGACVGIYSVAKVRRRYKLFLTGSMVGVANFLCIVGIGYLNNLAPQVFLKEGMWGIANGLLSFFIVMGFLPVLEWLFKMTTNITLLELSDLNHPILKEMVIKAPGTYHHSLVVGNLAEAACDAIGANSLLARIGAYYHDIGKIEKAAYFTENETDPRSRHTSLKPSMSALIITGHVKDGTELARKYKLNPVITDFIEQHHGTSLIYYFYQKALEKGLRKTELKENEFRYPGPKPQTKETAIVLLADSVEASSRTLSNPIPSRIKDLVQRIINNKFIDNQLDECDLTLRDLNKISESFVRTLSGIFHTRVEYPKEKDIANSKNIHAQDRDNKPDGGKNPSEASPEEGGSKNA